MAVKVQILSFVIFNQAFEWVIYNTHNQLNVHTLVFTNILKLGPGKLHICYRNKSCYINRFIVFDQFQ